MILGDVEETVTTVEIDEETYEEVRPIEKNMSREAVSYCAGYTYYNCLRSFSGLDTFG